MLMIKTFTSTNCVNLLHQSQETTQADHLDESDLILYENLKPELDKLSYSPSDDTINRILAYAQTGS
jgi:hypothetical protein